MPFPSPAFACATAFPQRIGVFPSARCGSTRGVHMTASTDASKGAASLNVRAVPNGGVTTARGFQAAGVTAGFKPSGAPDLAILLAEGAAAVGAGVFTTNEFRAVPVDLAEMVLSHDGAGRVKAVVINSGQANAATGAHGADDAYRTVAAAAAAAGCSKDEVVVASTGVIGKRYDIAKMEAALPGAVARAGDGAAGGGAEAARAIMTTDLRAKEVGMECDVGGKTVRVGGMCKGSGMIHPDMATMLGFVTCDAEVPRAVWRGIVSRAADASFNMITVDGDTSTNDVLVGLCSGAGGVVVAEEGSAECAAVESMVTAACVGLAKMIARDGEGATVLLEVRVSGAETEKDARKIARTVAGSHLFKAAVFGRDPNWGRIAGAAGRAGVKLDMAKVGVRLGPHTLMVAGEPVEYDAKLASEYLKGKAEAGEEGYCSEEDTVVVEVSVGEGAGEGVAWGCDLSYDYVKINSEYTT